MAVVGTAPAGEARLRPALRRCGWPVCGGTAGPTPRAIVAGLHDDELAHHPAVLVLEQVQWNMYGTAGSV